jgi:hypothetical protein
VEMSAEDLLCPVKGSPMVLDQRLSRNPPLRMPPGHVENASRCRQHEFTRVIARVMMAPCI